jgi:hypothetical protein
MRNKLKYLTVIISLSLLFGGEAVAKKKFVKTISSTKMSGGNIIETVCIDGWIYVTSTHPKGGTSIVPFWITKFSAVEPVPVKCKE